MTDAAEIDHNWFTFRTKKAALNGVLSKDGRYTRPGDFFVFFCEFIRFVWREYFTFFSCLSQYYYSYFLDYSFI